MNSLVALDTNAYRALDDGNANVAQVLRQASVVGMPITVLGEIYYGIFNGSRQQENLSKLQKFLLSDRVEVLQIDASTAKLYGEISAELRSRGRIIQQNDVWIAALCKQYGYALATADTDFKCIIGLELVSF